MFQKVIIWISNTWNLNFGLFGPVFKLSDHMIWQTIWIPDIQDHKTDIFVWFSDHHLTFKPFAKRTHLDHLNTRLVWYSDSYCILSPLNILFLQLKGQDWKLYHHSDISLRPFQTCARGGRHSRPSLATGLLRGSVDLLECPGVHVL